MTSPRKGIRNIVVGGERYRWVVSGTDAPVQMDLIVERAGSCSSTLIVGAAGPVVITPRLVARIVTAAVRGGWAPQERGKDFRCHLDEDRLIPYRPSEATADLRNRTSIQRCRCSGLFAKIVTDSNRRHDSALGRRENRDRADYHPCS